MNQPVSINDLLCRSQLLVRVSRRELPSLTDFYLAILGVVLHLSSQPFAHCQVTWRLGLSQVSVISSYIKTDNTC